MRGFFIFSALTALSVPAFAGDESGEIHDRIDSVVVSVSRAGSSTPVTFTMVGKDELKGTSPRNSLPMTLSFQPSVVVTNEGGTGLGYSKMTVRGSKGSQINVTLNGITLNDAESQEVFWVNIPSLSSILSSVQVQRGLGTSASGTGAFGASINMNTAFAGSEPTASFDYSRGAYNTSVTTVSAGTGITPSGFYANAAYSKGTTDGYIRNAWADVQSAFAALGWIKGNNSVRLTWLLGDQHTGITWDGISLSDYKKDRRSNSAGAWTDANGNTRYYGNESDNYRQNHLQLNYTRQFNASLAWTTTLNYTNGYGYDEMYKANKKFSQFGIFGHEGNSDFIIRKLLSNNYVVANSELRYRRAALDLTGGVNVSRYSGDHYGDVLWSSALGDTYDYSVCGACNNTNPWYFNNGVKKEAGAFVRAEYRFLRWLTVYADLQYRHIRYDMSGVEDKNKPMDYGTTWNFFNPRGGVNVALDARQSLYASVAVGHREPGRGDIKEILSEESGRRLNPESMVDIEAGYRYNGEKLSASANIYMMEYRDMLLETGRLNASGYALKDNVGKSYRRGIEIAGAWAALPELLIEANTTLSTNKIVDHTQYYATYDNEDDWNVVFPQYKEHLGKVTMLMSPSVTAKGRIGVTPFKNMTRGSLRTTTLSFECQYVGKQYWDNTQDEGRKVPAYFVSDLSLTHEFRVRGGVLGLSGYINNLFNRKYYADAWGALSYMNSTESVLQEEGIFPQAPVNFMFKISYRL